MDIGVSWGYFLIGTVRSVRRANNCLNFRSVSDSLRGCSGHRKREHTCAS